MKSTIAKPMAKGLFPANRFLSGEERPNTKKIPVVDDDPSTRGIARNLLENQGPQAQGTLPVRIPQPVGDGKVRLLSGGSYTEENRGSWPLTISAGVASDQRHETFGREPISLPLRLITLAVKSQWSLSKIIVASTVVGLMVWGWIWLIVSFVDSLVGGPLDGGLP